MSAKFFREHHFSFCVVVYDARRGNTEGEEADKILSFHPASASTDTQIGIVGLAQALVMFSGSFNKNDEEFYSMEADLNRWGMFKCEDDIWMLMVVSKAWATSSCTPRALQQFLHTVHSVFVLLHGAITHLVDQDGTAYLARRALHPFMHEVAARLLRPDTRELSGLANPLGSSTSDACPILSIGRRPFNGLHSLVNHLLMLSVFGSRVVHGVVVCYSQFLLWSTASPGDTAALFHLASRSILPAVKAGARHRPVPRSKVMESHPPCLLGSGAWELLPSGLVLPVPPGHEAATAATPSSTPASSSSSSASLAPAPLQPPAAVNAPSVFLQDGEERCLLLPYRCGPLVLLLLLHAAPPPGPETTSTLLGLLGPRCSQLSEELAAEVPLTNTWHVPGYRYLYQDDVCGAVRASPQNKVATLSSQSLSLLAELRSQVELEVASSSGGTESLEVVCRAAHECWAVARLAGPRQLYVAVEADKEGGMPGVCQHVQLLCDKLFPGIFPS